MVNYCDGVCTLYIVYNIAGAHFKDRLWRHIADGILSNTKNVKEWVNFDYIVVGLYFHKHMSTLRCLMLISWVLTIRECT